MCFMRQICLDKFNFLDKRTRILFNRNYKTKIWFYTSHNRCIWLINFKI